jgi:hypothetical protein
MVNYFHIPRNSSHKIECDVEINSTYIPVWLTEKRATHRLLLITQFVTFVNKMLSDTHILLEGLILLLLILLLCWIIDIIIGGRNSIVGIAICYGTDGVGSKSGGRYFPCFTTTSRKPLIRSIKSVPVFFQ